MSSDTNDDKRDEEKDIRWQDYASSAVSMSTVKVEDITTKVHKLIGYHKFISPGRFIAFNTEWNKLGVQDRRRSEASGGSELHRLLRPNRSA